MRFQKLLAFILLSTICLSSCSVSQNLDSTTGESTSSIESGLFGVFVGSNESNATATPFQPLPEPSKIYYSHEVPSEWIQEFTDIEITSDPMAADLTLSIAKPATSFPVLASFERIFTVGAPFPTITDEVSLTDLLAVWHGEMTATGFFSKLYVTESTKSVLTIMWGFPNDQTVLVRPKDEIVSTVWEATDAWAIIPFEDIEPRLKIMYVDGISPLDKPMDTSNYPLTITYTLSGSETTESKLQEDIKSIISFIPATNRDESKMTVLVMSGTTALARVTLRKIEMRGYDYPVELVKNWFLSADLRHVSNEVSFNENCKYTDAYTMQFCSKPDQIAVFENLGINVVESTGNHLNDYEGDHFAETLQMYEDRGWLNFGGGINAEEAKKPATIEINGNRIAFIGCNPVEIEQSWATETKAGAAKCDYPYYYQTISDLKAQGYVVVATYQYYEYEGNMYPEDRRITFQEAAAAGADIVQGSQAHVAMGFEFVNDTLIHYGLGNFLFDQMKEENLPEFIDRHIIYDGEYIATELLTARMTDWSRPVPMTEKERTEFLATIFEVSEMR